MIAFSTVDFDLNGSVIVIGEVANSNDKDNLSRRVQRTKTLDGGVVIIDYGYSVGDRTIKVTIADITEQSLRNIQRLIQTYSGFIICTNEGAFHCAVSDLTYLDGIGEITFLVEREA